MKHTDWAILFAALFLCSITVLDMKAAIINESLYTREQYNRILDRAVEDSMNDAVRMELDAGVEIDREKILEHLTGQLFFTFGIITQEDRNKLLSCISAVVLTEADGYYTAYLKDSELVFSEKILYTGETAGAQEKMEQVRNQIQYLVNERQQGNRQIFSFPYIVQEEWYQTIDNIQLLVVFQGLPVGDGTETYERICMAGARIEKRSTDD